MQILLADEVEPVVAGLLGGISTSIGPTDEQMIVLKSITQHLWGRDDIDVHNLTPLSPDEVAKRLQRSEARLRFAEVMMTLELCRHPMSLEQVDLAEKYVTAMGVDRIEIETTRTAIVKGAEAAATDLEPLLSADPAGDLGVVAARPVPAPRQARPRTRRAPQGAPRSARGPAGCTVDLSQVDHLSIAHLPLEQVRERFSVVPLQSLPRRSESTG